MHYTECPRRDPPGAGGDDAYHRRHATESSGPSPRSGGIAVCWVDVTVNRLLSIAAGTLRGADPIEMVGTAAAAGFDALGFGFEHRDLGARELSEIARRLDESGVTVLDIEAVRIAPSDDNDCAKRLIEYGAALGARHLLVLSNDEDESRTADRFAEICAIAEAVGIRPVLEFMAFTAVTSLAAAVAIVTRSGTARGGVLIDSLHLERCGDSAQAVASFDPNLFPYIQICDGPAHVRATPEELATEARHARLMPGAGQLRIQELIHVLPRDTALSIEVLSDALDGLDPLVRASLTMEASRGVLDAIEASWPEDTPTVRTP